MITEIVTTEMLERELNSRNFRSGLETCIKITLKNGCETSFSVEKRKGNDVFSYDGMIQVGNTKSVGNFVGEEFAEKLYRDKTGKEPYQEDGIPTQDYFEFLSENKFDIVEYAIKDKKIGFKSSNISFEDMHNWYELLHLHTHPSGLIFPSSNDVKFLNGLRKRFGSEYRPITLIVGVDKPRTNYPILLLQENTDKPIEENKLEEARDSIKGFFKPKYEDRFNWMYSSSSPYNVGMIYFTPGKRSKIHADLFFGLGIFSYNSDEKGGEDA